MCGCGGGGGGTKFSNPYSQLYLSSPKLGEKIIKFLAGAEERVETVWNLPCGKENGHLLTGERQQGDGYIVIPERFPDYQHIAVSLCFLK